MIRARCPDPRAITRETSFRVLPGRAMLPLDLAGPLLRVVAALDGVELLHHLRQVGAGGDDDVEPARALRRLELDDEVLDFFWSQTVDACDLPVAQLV